VSTLFYVSAVVALIATVMVVTRSNAVHALLYFVVSLLSVALIFYTLGAPFAAALEVIIYAGAIMVLFVFVVMMLNLGKSATARERHWIQPDIWTGPAVLSAILAAELCYMLASAGGTQPEAPTVIDAKSVGIALFGPYLLAVELASMLLLAGLVAAYHLARAEARS
jgi:NADH-quinone oxidoreductase subunit J